MAVTAVGVVGLGRIGVLVAQRLAAFGMNVIAYDPYVQAGRAAQVGVRLVDLDTLVAESDFMSVHLPKTPETIGLIGAEQLAAAKPGLVLVNAARGGIVDEAALYDALTRIPGVEVDHHARDLLGRPGVGITRSEDRSPTRSVLVIDPTSGETLGARYLMSTPTTDVVFGATAVTAPDLGSRLFRLDAAGNPQLPYMTRLFASREIALGAATLLASGKVRRNLIVAGIAVGRPGRPEDVAHAVSYFCDERSGFVSGQVLYVAGGPRG